MVVVLFCGKGAAWTKVESESKVAAPESTAFERRMLMMSLVRAVLRGGFVR
jgi:hypothetical protein